MTTGGITSSRLTRLGLALQSTRMAPSILREEGVTPSQIVMGIGSILHFYGDSLPVYSDYHVDLPAMPVSPVERFGLAPDYSSAPSRLAWSWTIPSARRPMKAESVRVLRSTLPSSAFCNPGFVRSDSAAGGFSLPYSSEKNCAWATRKTLSKWSK